MHRYKDLCHLQEEPLGPKPQQYHIPRQEMGSMFQEPEPGTGIFYSSSPWVPKE